MKLDRETLAGTATERILPTSKTKWKRKQAEITTPCSSKWLSLTTRTKFTWLTVFRIRTRIVAKCYNDYAQTKPSRRSGRLFFAKLLQVTTVKWSSLLISSQDQKRLRKEEQLSSHRECILGSQMLLLWLKVHWTSWLVMMREPSFWETNLYSKLYLCSIQTESSLVITGAACLASTSIGSGLLLLKGSVQKTMQRKLWCAKHKRAETFCFTATSMVTQEPRICSCMGVQTQRRIGWRKESILCYSAKISTALDLTLATS